MKTLLSARRAVARLGLLALTACGRERIDVGAEGDAINGGVCFGARCSPVGSRTLDSLEPSVCNTDDPVGTYSSTFAADTLNATVVGASDDSGWVIRTEYDESQELTIIEHYDANGVLMGAQDPFLQSGDHTAPVVDLAPVPGRGAFVYVHSSFAATADGPYSEWAALYALDSAARSVGSEIPLTSVAYGKLKASTATVTLAALAPHGSSGARLVRLATAGAPEFIHPRVPAAGTGQDPSIGDLVLFEEGRSAVLTLRASSVEDQTHIFGISVHDRTGSQIADWVLPTEFRAGFTARLARTPNGTLVVMGFLSHHRQLILGYSADGEALFAWEVPAADQLPMMVDAETGSIVADVLGGLVVLPEDGSDCRLYSGDSQPGTVVASPWAGTLTFSDGWTLTRQGGEGLPEAG